MLALCSERFLCSKCAWLCLWQQISQVGQVAFHAIEELAYYVLWHRPSQNLWGFDPLTVVTPRLDIHESDRNTQLCFALTPYFLQLLLDSIKRIKLSIKNKYLYVWINKFNLSYKISYQNAAQITDFVSSIKYLVNANKKAGHWKYR